MAKNYRVKLLKTGFRHQAASFKGYSINPEVVMNLKIRATDYFKYPGSAWVTLQSAHDERTYKMTLTKYMNMLTDNPSTLRMENGGWISGAFTWHSCNKGLTLHYLGPNEEGEPWWNPEKDLEWV